MTEAITPPVETSTQGSADEQQQQKDVVSYETHRRLLDEKKREQQARKELEARLQAFENEKRTQEEEKLRQQGEYQKLLQLKEEKLKAYEQKFESIESRLQTATKINAFIKAAGTDLEEKWLGLINPKDIQIRPDDGEVDMLSVQNAVETFKKTWPEAFKQKGATIPAEMPNGKGYITESEWRTLPDKKKYKHNQILWGK